jgi:hypothetical protein
LAGEAEIHEEGSLPQFHYVNKSHTDFPEIERGTAEENGFWGRMLWSAYKYYWVNDLDIFKRYFIHLQ